MKPRWIAWVLASVAGPALPWVFMHLDDQGTTFMTLIGVALVLQLIASIRVAVGLARIRGLGAGGVFGFSIVFMLASVAIGSAVFFVACFGALSMQ
jgi:hypothetical protein